jgi:hypothetical protein
MKSKFLAAATVLLVLSGIRLGALQGSGSGGGGDKNPPAQSNPQQTGDQTKNTDQSLTGSQPPKPSIAHVVPASPTISCNAQKLKLIGTGFQKDLTVTLAGPDGKKTTLSGADVTWVSETEVQINPTLSTEGPWKVSLANPDKSTADETAFQVIAADSPAVAAYNCVFWVITGTLALLGLVLIGALWHASAKGKWSLGSALSEEAAVQPQQIKSKDDVVMVGSTSRLIALVGLLGILVMVLGIGYSIIWNLFVAGRSPDLSSVKSFLFGAASLFAPYLANQVRAAFDQSPAPTPAPQDASALSITGVIPGSPQSGAAQPLTLTGKGFGTGLTVTLVNPAGTPAPPITIAPNQINPTQLTLNNVDLDAPGNWTIKVIGPGGSQSTSADFLVHGAPIINGAPTLSTAPVGAAGPAPRDITLTGRGFMEGLSASVVAPGGGAPITPTVKSRTYTQLVLTATLTTGTSYQLTVTNPGGFAAPQQQFTA